MALWDGPCEVTGKPGVIDELSARCACVSPFMAVFCDGTIKDLDLWREYVYAWGAGRPSYPDVPLPQMPPGSRSFWDPIVEEMEKLNAQRARRRALCRGTFVTV